MGVFKDRIFRRELLIYIALTAVFASLGFGVDVICGVLVLCAGICTCALSVIIAVRRRRELARFCEDIDRVLHGQDEVYISRFEEGELSLLDSEIHKMTVRLKEQADMLTAEKSRLTSAIEDISHQMRTPLTSMNLALSMLAREDTGSEERVRLSHDIKRQLDRTRWLVETLLKMSKIDSGTAAFRSDSVSARELIGLASEPYLIPMELKGINLSVSVGEESYTGDRAWSVEALGNIIKNCVEHTPSGGIVEIVARETALFTEITVRDNGSGISQRDLPHIFERFYRGEDATHDSIGIGLALSRMIIAAQNGTVSAVSSGEGTVFTVRFYKSVI